MCHGEAKAKRAVKIQDVRTVDLIRRAEEGAVHCAGEWHQI